MKRLFSLAVALAACVCAHAVWFSSAPGSVDSGQSYWVSADESTYSYDTEIYLYKNGSFFAYGNGWGYASAGNSTTDYGAQTVTYEAYSSWYDDWWNSYGDYTSTSVSITQPNNAPSISWHVSPSWVPVGENYYVQVRGYDPDGNLYGVSVWKNGVPYALNGGQNTTEMYSDVNWLAEGSPQQITFSAQAYDNSGAQSEIIYHTVNIYVPNVAPTVTWVNYPPQSAYINQSFAVQARGNDNNANLSWIYVWRDDQPFAFNGASGAEGYSDNNLATGTAPYPTTFKAMAGDTSGADSGFIYGTTSIINRNPTMTPTTITGPTVAWNSTYQHYTMWSGDPGISGSGNLTMASTIQDADANLVNHTLRYRQVTLNPNTWIQLGNNVPVTASTSTKQATLTTVETPGQWDFNAFGHDGWYSHPGESKTMWVYGSTNTAAFVSQAINGTALTGATPTISLNTGNNTATATILMRNTGSKPWQNPDSQFNTPHRLGAIGATPGVWGSSVRDMASAMVDPESFPGTNDTATFSFTFNIPQTPGNYVFQWKMLEQGVAGDPFFETATPAVTVTVIDTTPPIPSVLQLVAKTHNSVSLSWTAATDNSGSIAGYNLYRNGSLVQTLGNVLSFTDPGLTANTAYAYTVKARDAANNLSAASNQINVTTRLTPGQDQDGDGLPNEWEEDNSLNPFANDAESDPDHDGLTNIAEYNLGKNPNTYDQGTSTLGGAVPAGWTSLAAADGSIPMNIVVGATAGTLAVDKSGAATYSVPLWTTPGTAGMQPQLSLNYSSQSGAGIAGLGWSLGGASAITRGPQTLAIDGQNRGLTLTASDRFYLDGQRLIYVGGGTGYGTPGSEYRTELESFTKVVANGSAGSGPESFTAWTKAGLIIQFGQTADSAFDAWGKSEKLAWHANQISDTSGNYMDFVYTEDAGNGVHRLDRINYTGNGGVTPYASVRFEYEDRPDPVSGYAAGSPVASLQRLKYVKSYHGNDVARTYTLDYVTAPRNNRSQLSAITETGVGGERYQPLTFEYEDNVEGWDDGTAFLPPYYLADNSNSGRPAGSGFIDFDGDGRTDFVARRDGAGINYAYRNTGAGWTADSNYLLPYQLAENENADDQGSRFADLNGDGLIDYIVNKDDYGTGAGNDVNEAWLNMGPGVGWSSATQWRVPVPIYRDGTTNDHPQRGGKFLDVNGDGRVDFVAHLTNSSGTFVNLAVYLNNGSTWDGQHANYSSLPGFSGTNLPKYKPRFIDLNGDGLPDIAVRYEYGGDVLNRVWLNTGNGWSEDATAIAYRLPKTIANDTNPGPGAEFADVNGDGLPDLVWYRELSGGGQERGVAINTGAGWNVPGAGSDLYNRHAPPQPLARDGHVSAGSAFIDLNADGITDYVFSRQFSGQSAQKEIYYGNLKEWGYAGSGADHNLAHLLLQEGVNQPGADFVDFNGDGVVDVVWKRKHASGSPADFADLRLNRAKPINGRLKKVTNGFGVEASVTYSSLMDPSVYTKGSGGPADSVNLIGPMYVVSALTHDDGVGGTYQVTYAYAGLRAERVRGSLGFASMTVTDTRKNIVSTTAFKQGYPFIGMPEGSSTTHGGVNLSESSVTYGEKLLNGGATRFVFAQSSTETTRDLDGSLIGSVTTSVPTPSTDIDDYGNIWKLVVDSGGGFTKTTDSVYANVTTGGNWFLGRLTSSSVKSTAPDVDDITRKSAFTYYSSTTGLLEKEIVEPDDSTLTLKLTTTYGYDQFGNKTSVEVRGKSLTVDNNGNYIAGVDTWRTTTTQYDTQGRFPNWTENAAGHRENYTGYDQVRGLLTGMTGANLLPTSWGYDGFGRKTQENRADGTVTYIRYKWASAAAPAGAKYLVESESSGVPPTLAFYDKFGRVFATPAITGDGALVWQETQFDNQGRATATSNPHFAGATVYWTVNTGIDALDRPTQIQTPDDQNGTQTTSTTYAGLTITVTDAKNRVSKTVKNSQGWTLENIRNDGNPSAADYSRVAYTYDALGNLTQTDAAGVATTLAYDLRGRKTTMTDPDMGAWLYRYNIFGELIWQKDAKGQITTLAYDSLGRLTSRVEAEGTTTWTYDTAPNGGSTWKGKLHTVSSPGGYAETYLYDSFGRPSKLTRTIDSGTFDFDTAYDSLGRPLKTTYPTVNGGRFATRQVYNAFGYLKEIRSHLGSDDGKPNSQLEGRVFWEADHYDQSGRIDGEVLGNGLVNDRVYSAATGRLLAASVDKGRVTNAPYAIQQMVYTYDQVGNVLTRADQAVGRGESFAYDGLDRLLTHNVVTGVGGTVTVAYDQKGNITSKSDVGTYAYDPTKKHALTGVSGGPLGSQTYNYDANGNMLSGGGRSITWTSFNQAASTVKGSYSSTFSFGASHERVKQVSHLETTIYVGGLFEKVTPVGGGAVTEFKHYIMAPTGRVAVYTDRSNLVRDTRFFHTDGLGSITAVSDEKGVIVKRFAFDAWGKRLDPATGATITGATAASFRRGYTDHEQMDDLGLVHMNGRVYDPVLGRFLSADPNVDGVGDAQGYNRYSYVGNNPLGATDPTGFFKLKDALKIAAVIVSAVVGFGVGYGATYALLATNTALTAGQLVAVSTLAGGFTAGFASGFSGSLLNGGSIGDAFRSGLTGGAVGAVTAGLLSKVGAAKWGWFKRGIAHGFVQGGAAEATGGEFRHGFYAGFAVGATEVGIAALVEDSRSLGLAAAAVVGGTASELGGGKFANGAVSGAFSYLFNQLSESFIEKERGAKLNFDGSDGSILFVEYSPELGSAGNLFRTAQQKKWGNEHLDVNEMEPGQSYADFVKARLGDRKFDNIVFGRHGGPSGAKEYMEKLYSTKSALVVALTSHLRAGGDIFMYQCYGICSPRETLLLSKAFGNVMVWRSVTIPYPSATGITARVRDPITGKQYDGLWRGTQATP